MKTKSQLHSHLQTVSFDHRPSGPNCQRQAPDRDTLRLLLWFGRPDLTLIVIALECKME
jgi:hypothetical protein